MDPLARIFGSPAKLKLLRFFVFNPEQSLTTTELAERTKISRATLRKEITNLVNAGVIKRRQQKGGGVYKANGNFEHALALSGFIRQTTAMSPAQMLSHLKKAGSLKFVALSGLFTGVIEVQADLLVVGDAIDDRALARAVAILEAELGREIRYAAFATTDFRYRLGVYDRLIRDVLDYPNRIILDRIGV